MSVGKVTKILQFEFLYSFLCEYKSLCKSRNKSSIFILHDSWGRIEKLYKKFLQHFEWKLIFSSLKQIDFMDVLFLHSNFIDIQDISYQFSVILISLTKGVRSDTANPIDIDTLSPTHVPTFSSKKLFNLIHLFVFPSKPRHTCAWLYISLNIFILFTFLLHWNEWNVDNTIPGMNVYAATSSWAYMNNKIIICAIKFA